METEEERRARLENDAATKRLRLAMEMDEERKARLEKMVATAQLMLNAWKYKTYIYIPCVYIDHQVSSTCYEKF